VLTVTNSNDAVNGDTSSPAALKANPGTDGISLREAITAVDNLPADYTINFAPSLLGATIQLGSSLPPLTAPHLTIDGDIQGNGTAGITIADALPPNIGLFVKATDVSLYAFALNGFSIGVVFTSTGNNQTFTNENATDLSITGGSSGITLQADYGDPSSAENTHNVWSSIQFIGNSMMVSKAGINVGVAETIGDDMSGVTIARNTVHLPAIDTSTGGAIGIGMGAGFGAGSQGNHIHSILVADNTVIGGPYPAIRLAAGDIGSNMNQLDHAVVAGNTITMPATDGNGRPYTAISVQTGDTEDTRTQPATYGNGNVVSNVSFLSNSINGQGGPGIVAVAGYNGAFNNQITGLDIEGNQINGVISTGDDAAGVALDGAGGGDLTTQLSSHNQVTNATVAYNSITLRSEVTWTPDASVLAMGGVSLIGGTGLSQSNIVGSVQVFNNSIDSDAAGITLLGGFGRFATPTSRNLVVGATLTCNSIPHAPTLIGQAGTKGISLVGGVFQSTQNGVLNTQLTSNDVAGVPNDASRFNNVGQGAVDNWVDGAREVRPSSPVTPGARVPVNQSGGGNSGPRGGGTSPGPGNPRARGPLTQGSAINTATGSVPVSAQGAASTTAARGMFAALVAAVGRLVSLL
jgi:hypothetical protein